MRRARYWISLALLVGSLAVAARAMAQDARPAPAAPVGNDAAPGPAGAVMAGPGTDDAVSYFSFWNDAKYGGFERWGLVVVLGVAVAGLIYALALVGQVVGADRGTAKMQAVADAIKKGANAYLARQFRAIILLVLLISGLLWATTANKPGS